MRTEQRSVDFDPHALLDELFAELPRWLTSTRTRRPGPGRQRERAPAVVKGRVRRTVGYSLEVTGCDQSVGSECLVEVEGGVVPAEVVGFSEGTSFLMPFGDVTGLHPGAAVRPQRERKGPVMEGLLGRVVDGLGRPLDGRPLEQTPIGSCRPPGAIQSAASACR